MPVKVEARFEGVFEGVFEYPEKVFEIFSFH